MTNNNNTEPQEDNSLIEEKKEKPTPIHPIDQWIGLTRELNFHKKVSLIISGFGSLLFTLILILLFQSPIVAVLNDQQIVMLKANRQDIPIGKEQVERIIKEFIRQRYQWKDLNPNDIIKKTEPYITEGLKEKLKPMLVDLKTRDLKDKNVVQEITDIEVNITEENIMAKFYKILVLEGLPLVVPTNLVLSVIQGAQTFTNPEGIYINKILESEFK